MFIKDQIVSDITEKWHHSELDQVEIGDDSYQTTLALAWGDSDKTQLLAENVATAHRLTQVEAIEAIRLAHASIAID